MSADMKKMLQAIAGQKYWRRLGLNAYVAARLRTTKAAPYVRCLLMCKA